MDEIKEIEESANSFLKNFYDTTYNDNKVLFNNMQSIYLLIIFLYYNMQELNIEKQDIQNGTRKDYVEKSKIIDPFSDALKFNVKYEFLAVIDVTFDKVLYVPFKNSESSLTSISSEPPIFIFKSVLVSLYIFHIILLSSDNKLYLKN